MHSKQYALAQMFNYAYNVAALLSSSACALCGNQYSGSVSSTIKGYSGYNIHVPLINQQKSQPTCISHFALMHSAIIMALYNHMNVQVT